MSLLEVIILSIIEGITEFLPISSTGHMILASQLMGMENTEFLKTFEIAIQFPAILAVVIIYRQRLLAGIQLYYKLFWAFIPTAIVGLLFYSLIREALFNTVVVSIMLIIGGIALILLDHWTKSRSSQYSDLEHISIKGALIIGFAQCLALIPGTSRAAATIVGGVVAGYNTRQATEFSFLLAIPTMAAASGYDLLKTAPAFSGEQFFLLAVGSVLAFLFAWAAVKIFLKIVVSYGLKHFGYYRIALALLFIALAWFFNISLF